MAVSLDPIANLGSGETSLVGGRIYEELTRGLKAPLHIALLETPAGFELNSAQVIGHVGEFMQKSLQNYDLTINYKNISENSWVAWHCGANLY
jgi:hypothetical protein